MTYAKLTAFTDEQQEIARLAKALSHPARIAIVEHLAKVGTCISGDIALELPLARATVSQHLQELKAVGLIQGNIEGQKVCYCLEPNAVQKLNALFASFLKNTLTASTCAC